MKKISKLKKICCLLSLTACFLLSAGCSCQELNGVFTDVTGNKQEVVCISSDRYAHNTLNEKQQIVYDEMLYAIMNMESSARLSTADQTDVQRCFNAICADYGEIFWVDTCSYSGLSLFGIPVAVRLDVKYSFTPEEVADYRASMRPVIDGYLDCLEACNSDYEKTEVLYRMLLEDVAYDINAENNQNIISVFLGKKTVCQGYACATQYLLQQAGIPCVIVVGTAQGQPHAWNMVQLDGEYYYLDVTWGNSDFLGESGPAAGSINYAYFNITTDELLINHQPEVDFPLAVCDTRADNFYVKSRLYFEVWDPDGIGAKITEAFDQKQPSVSLKFANEELFLMARTHLIEEQHITDYCRGISRIYYVPDEDLHILTIYF